MEKMKKRLLKLNLRNMELFKIVNMKATLTEW
jgi:hypothetical protein